MNKTLKQLLSLIIISFMLFSCANNKQEPSEKEIKERELLGIHIEEIDEGNIIYSNNGGAGYSYGPSIIRNEDGSYDAWFSAPGNNYSEWDYITYRHSNDGINWTSSEVVLKPTSGSLDQCSVCDPGVIYFDGYYYLAYSSTSDYNSNGMNNSAFVARSKYPDGPFEKWNGEGWGGDPYPFIQYEGDPEGWGIGEVSFVIKDDDLYIYYTYMDGETSDTHLSKAGLVENWPSTLRHKGVACSRGENDSSDFVYIEDLDVFLGFSIKGRMSEKSKIIIYESLDGEKYELVDDTKTNVEDYAHNVGISKDVNGHMNSDDTFLISYAYGQNWGRWSTKIHEITLSID